MALREIIIAPNPVLRAPCVAVSDFNGELHTLLDDMYESMLANNGIGLAAPQIGLSKAVAVIDLSTGSTEPPSIKSLADIAPLDHTHKERLELINPKIVNSATKVSSEEGCLSIPDYRETITRFETVTVEALDRRGRPFSLTAVDFLAFAIQHEVDHLNGVLFTDHLSRLKRTFFRKWAIRNLGSGEI
jgi:peptide deformylase